MMANKNKKGRKAAVKEGQTEIRPPMADWEEDSPMCVH